MQQLTAKSVERPFGERYKRAILSALGELNVLELQTLLNNYAAGPELLRTAVADVKESEFDALPISGTWSIRQVICHLADFEAVNADRMRRIIAEDNPTLRGADPDAFAAKLGYSQRDVEEELSLIELTVSQMLRILKSCDIEDFLRTGVHSEDGPLTLESLIERTTNHIPHHIAFIEAKRKAL